MVEPLFRWRFPDPVAVEPALASLARERGISHRLLAILAGRGVTSPAALESFLAPAASGLNEPELLPDAGVVVDRIALARRRGERAMVFGDFDADGLTALAILTLTLRGLGVDTRPYVPSRLEEGHGLSLAAITAAVDEGRTLILTADCGTSSGPEIAVANGLGIDVIVTDHHHVPPVAPPALALVNPHRADSLYPEVRLTGSGVAFRVAELLLGKASSPPTEPTMPTLWDRHEPAAILPGRTGDAGVPDLAELAALATIGTVADMAPILGENRAIARLGLERMRSAPRPGLAAMLARAHVPPETVDLETVGFVIAPRLNAAGRVGEAERACRLLLTDDPAEAEALADELEAANESRRDLTRTILAEAQAAMLAFDPARASVVIRGDWPVGIIGLVAGRLAEEHRKPVVVGANLGDTIRGSCRSGLTGRMGLNLAEALGSCSDLFIRHGGHAGAAGFELQADRWPAFMERFDALAAASAGTGDRPELALDLALPASEADYGLLRELALLAPTGLGNPDPLIAVLGLTVTRVRAAAGGHSQLTLRRRVDVIDGIAFDREDIATTVHEGDSVDVVGRLVSRRFGGLETLQLEIKDVSTSGSHPRAAAILAAAGGSAGVSPAASRVALQGAVS